MRRSILGCSFVLVCFLVFSGRLHAQLNLDAHAIFVEEHKNMTAEDLLREYPAGMFRRYAPADLNVAQFGPQVASKLELTTYERELIGNHSFMVTERLSYQSYNAAFLEGFVKDLPLYISSDAILHALHRSYDKMLQHMEEGRLSSTMGDALDTMWTALHSAAYTNESLVQKAVNDADVYISVARALIHGSSVQTVFEQNSSTAQQIMQGIEDESMQSVMLFSDMVPRYYDLSQFKPRGHYTVSERLSQYFRCLMWLGRTEIYITPPEPGEIAPTHVDIRRQCILSLILADLAERTQALGQINEVDGIISRFVGDQDNLTLPSLLLIMNKHAVGGNVHLRPQDLLSDSILTIFQADVRASGGEQKILSQMLLGGDSLNMIKPAAAFMLLGQRFILDSYILGNVVYDKVEHRMMPSPLDAMFALGNDAAAQLLMLDLQAYDYAPNLAGLRYLTSTMSTAYWESSLYTTWLNSIRALNPLKDRTSLPLFMQTGAWAQKQLNAQLTSWAELRHDNLLYAKQSYTGGVGCYYPDGFVEPVAPLYSGVATFARSLLAFVITLPPNAYDFSKPRLIGTLKHIDSTCRRLADMAEKELNGAPFSPEETALISNWIISSNVTQGCENFTAYTGVYPALYYGEDNRINEDVGDFVIADVHTQPTDELGNVVGNVLHVATGKINMAVVVATDPSDGCATAYVGPVGSFYQHITSGFNRLSDEEWVTLYKDSTVPRPSWVYSYIASARGESLGEPQTLTTTGVSEPLATKQLAHMSIAPNPTSSSATIAFVIPPSNTGKSVVIEVVNANGVVVSTLQSSPLESGNYLTRWDGKTQTGESVTAGTYYIRVQMGATPIVQQVVVIR